jgi:GTP diphosphokinase / guanosine-3',5'-bis(diphosphate) 3'-diphosphatase
MMQRDKPYEEIYDLMAMRVIVETVADCYHALGVIHNKWTPLQERFHDYIATPKSNLYRSLHTTIFGPGRAAVRDPDPDARDAPHRGVRHRGALEVQGGRAAGERGRRDALLVPAGARVAAGDARAGGVHGVPPIDLFQDEIFVFTPQGDVKQLPRGATPIDFAFAVHTEVGLHCAGAKVNGRITPLSRELKNGDTVEIMTDDEAAPVARLAGVREDGARAEQDPAVDPRGGVRQLGRLGKEFIEREMRKARRGRSARTSELRGARRGARLPGQGAPLRGARPRRRRPVAVFRELWPDAPEPEQQRPPSPSSGWSPGARQGSQGCGSRGWRT